MTPREEYMKETGEYSHETAHIEGAYHELATDEYVEWLENKYKERDNEQRD